jgi:hypothetical protein
MESRCAESNLHSNVSSKDHTDAFVWIWVLDLNESTRDTNGNGRKHFFREGAGNSRTESKRIEENREELGIVYITTRMKTCQKKMDVTFGNISLNQNSRISI